jgi:predicted PurR-regulated permease PerM
MPAVDRYLSNTSLLLGWLLLVSILAIFFLRDGDHIANVLVDLLFPRERRATMRATAVGVGIVNHSHWLVWRCC